MFTRIMLLGLLLASLSTLFCADVRAQSTDDDFDVYDYPHPEDNWSYGIVDSCQTLSARGPLGGTHDWQWKSDRELKEAVTCAIESSPFIKTSKGIDVSVNEGIAVLSGTVEDQDSMRSAIVDAYGAGVKDVVSQLEVVEEQ